MGERALSDEECVIVLDECITTSPKDGVHEDQAELLDDDVGRQRTREGLSF